MGKKTRRTDDVFDRDPLLREPLELLELICGIEFAAILMSAS
jgi:hypothetical protein